MNKRGKTVICIMSKQAVVCSGLGEAVLNLLECPVCLEVARGGEAVYSCENGHLVCRPCKPRIANKSCPSCRNRRLFRVRFAERLAREASDIVRFKCKFAHNGCAVEMTVADAASGSHQRHCIFRDLPCVGKYNPKRSCQWSGSEHLLPFHQGESGCFEYAPCAKTGPNTFSFETDVWGDGKPRLLGHIGGDLTRFQIYVEWGWKDRVGPGWSARVRVLCPADVARDVAVTVTAAATDATAKCTCKTREFFYRGGVYSYVDDDGKEVVNTENELLVRTSWYWKLRNFTVTVVVPDWEPDDAGFVRRPSKRPRTEESSRAT